MTLNEDLINYIISDKKNILETIEDRVTNITYYTLKDLVESYGYKLYDNAACIDVKLRPNITFDVEKELNISREQFFDALYNNEIPNFAEDLSLSFDNFVVHGRSGGYWGLDNVKENVELTDKFAEDLAAEILGDSIEYWVEYRKDYVDDFRNLDSEELVYDYIVNTSTDSNVLELNNIDYLELNKDYISDLKSLSDDIDFMEKEWNNPSYWGEFNESLRKGKIMTLNEDIQKILGEKSCKKESLTEEDDFMYTSSAISGVLTDKLNDLSLKIDNLKREVTKVFPDTKVQTKEKAEELKEKYAAIYFLLKNINKSIEELSNKVK